VEVLTPQFNPDSGETPSELAALRSLALEHHKSILAAREVVRCRNAYMGRYDEGETILPWKPNCVHPKVHEIVERFTSVLTDSRVKFEPHARNDEDELLAKALIGATDFEWERQRMDLKMQIGSRAVLTDGTVHLYTGLDWQGECDTKILSPFSWIPDPSATDETDLSWGFARFGMTRNEIEKKWPNSAAMIFERVDHGTAPLREENTFNTIGTGWPRTANFGTLQGSGLSVATDMEFSTPQTPKSQQGRRYRVEEWWFARGEERELTVDLADDTQAVIEMPSMARGRRMYVIEGHYFGDLQDPDLDGPNPFDHGMIPVSRIAAIQLIGEYQGLPYIQPGLDTAVQLADIDNQIMGNVRLMMHPIWLVPFEARIDVSKFFSAPGMVLPYRAPHEPKAHTPPALPAYVFELRQIKQQEFDNAMGINDISRGNYSGGLEDVSGKAVQLLQRPAYTRMKPIQMSMEYAVTRWGQQLMCNIMQFWPEERWRRVLPQEIADMPLPWLVEKQEQMMLGAPPSSVDKYLPEIRMQAGSNLPENQEAKNGLVFNLFDRGAFGPPGTMPASLELMKGTKYPDAENLAQQGAMAQQQMMMQQAAMAAAQPQGNGGGPPGTGNKAQGAERSPAEDQNVMANLNGQEVGA
jgi:hypothetical protein